MKRLAVIFSLLVAVTGCNSGSGDGGNVPESRPDGNVEGTAFDGLIINGDVRVYGWDGERGDLLGEGTTNNSGEYSITLEDVPSQPVLLEVTNGRYKEEASGNRISLQEGDALYAVTQYKQGDNLDTALTYYTTLAAGLAEHMVETGTEVDKAITRANSTVSDFIGIDVTAVTPVDVTDSDNAAPNATKQHLYGFSTASISHLTAWISEENGRQVHDPYSSIKFAEAAYQDIRHDGKLNGKGPDGQVAMGAVPLTPRIYRHRIAANMLVMANDERNATNIGSEAVLDTAKQLNSSNASTFASKEIKPLSSVSPTITNLSHAEDDVVAGSLTLSASVTDPMGLDQVEFFVDGQMQAMSTKTSPEFVFDTRSLSDGQHDVRLVATNVTGAKTEKVVSLNVINSGTTITDVTPQESGYVHGQTTFSASVIDPAGVDTTQFKVDGAIYNPDSATEPSIELDTSKLGEGQHTLTISVTNSVGNKTSRSVDFVVDNTDPQIAWNLNDGQALSNTHNFTANVSDNEATDQATLYVDGNVEKTFNSGSSLSYGLNTLNFTEGAHTLVLELTDKAGNKSSVSKDVYFDSTPPNVSLVSPSRSTTISDGNMTIKFDAFDAAGLSNLTIEVNNRSYSVSPSTGRSTKTISTSPFQNGDYTVTVKAKDHGGFQRQSSTTGTFVHQPAKLSLIEKNVTGDASEGGHGAPQVSYSQDVILKIENYVEGESYSLQRAWLSNGNDIPFPVNLNQTTGRITHSRYCGMNDVVYDNGGYVRLVSEHGIKSEKLYMSGQICKE